MRYLIALVTGGVLAVLGPNWSAAAVVLEVEPNNSLATAQSITTHFSLDFSPDIGSGDFVTNTSTTIPHVTILGGGDGTYDYYSFYIPGTLWRYGIFDIDHTSSAFDSHLAIWAADGTLLGHNDDYDHRGGAGGSTSDADSLHALYLLAPGTYVVGVAKSPASPEASGFTGSAPGGGDFYSLQVSIEEQPIPEPSTLVLLVTMGVLCSVVAACRIRWWCFR